MIMVNVWRQMPEELSERSAELNMAGDKCNVALDLYRIVLFERAILGPSNTNATNKLEVHEI